MGGARRAVLRGERDWLLARIAAATDLTLRPVQAELAGRGVTASYGAVWSFFAAVVSREEWNLQESLPISHKL